jgi:hypothetical protein
VRLAFWTPGPPSPLILRTGEAFFYRSGILRTFSGLRPLCEALRRHHRVVTGYAEKGENENAPEILGTIVPKSFDNRCFGHQ